MKKLIFVMFSMCIAACAEHDEMGSTLIVNRAQKNRSMSEAIQLVMMQLVYSLMPKHV